ncbi:M23 family metallopeptidase [Clostridium sp. MSJ-8]|uniref:M23 family metallopeptidase n=1 Tax=Clostridium sp. MSJ-8 TaxID=2841510 RepID=UPI001C0EF239|nr:M23 family metallopeptidase [Clostridium sp. MSJ-8]MBU5488868.1 M23 family metallopeptidase [Clostridium sp. MSJ-8]
MDKNFKFKAKNFFRREGFYIALFLCLSVVITVTAISYKISKDRKLEQAKEDTVSNDFSIEDNSSVNEMQNAARVENDSEELETTSEEGTAEVNAVTEVSFNNPVEGTISREYSETPIKYHETDNSVIYKTMNGIDIKANIGTEVRAAADGIVEKIEKNKGEITVEDGVNVVILHQNGMRTKYSNLDYDVLVNEGDAVNSETVIGKVGATASLFKEGYDEHLNLQLFDENGEQINPSEYFKY